jgi:hypothetical protein
MSMMRYLLKAPQILSTAGPMNKHKIMHMCLAKRERRLGKEGQDMMGEGGV